MTKRENVRAAIGHRQPERMPYLINLTLEGHKIYDRRLIERYADAKILKDLKYGRINEMEAASLAIGNCVHSFSPPWWNWRDVPAEYRLSHEPPYYLPNTVGVGNYEAFFEHLNYISENYDAYILISIYGCHFEKAQACRGFENFMADIGGEPGYVKKLLKKIIDKNLVMIDNIAASPEIDGILLGSDWGSQASLLMSLDDWDDLIAPGEQAEFDLIKEHGKDVWIHSCGNIAPLLPRLVDMGMQVLNPVQPECMDIFELKDRFGGDITFWGGISTQRTLPYGTPDDVRRETETLIARLGKGGGLITAPSQEIQVDVPFENLIALIEAARNG